MNKETNSAKRSDAAPQEGIITSIERQSRRPHRYNLFIDHAFALSVHEDILIKHRLSKGERVERDRLVEIAADEELQAAWVLALRYLGRRPHSNKEMRMYLKRKGYEPSLVDKVIERLIENGYLNDEQFAQQWTENRIHLQSKGKRWVKQELQQKGVAPELIRDALDQVDPEAELDAAVQLGSKRWKTQSGSVYDRRRKVAAFLLRRGYGSSLVSQAIRRIEETAPPMEEESNDAGTESEWDDFFLHGHED